MSGSRLAVGNLFRGHWSLLAVMAAYLATLALLPQRGLWMVDNENRYLQLRAVADSGFREYAIRWPGRDLDPTYRLNPLRFDPEGTFAAFRDGQLISVFQPAFLLVGAAAWRLFGPWGLNLLPVIGAGFMLAGVAALGRRLHVPPAGRHLAVLLAGLATPAWFYSQNLWEHTCAAAFCTWGVVGIVRFHQDHCWRSLVLGCAGLATALFFRDVLGIFAVCLLVPMLMRTRTDRRRAALTAGIVLGAGLGLLAAFQWAVTGRPLGVHADTLLGGGGLVAHLAKRPRIIYLYLIAAHPVRSLSYALSAPFLIAFAIRPRLTAARAALGVPLWSLAAALAGAGFLAGIIAAENPLRHLLAANSFFVAAPVLLLGLLRPAPERPQPGADAGDLVLTATRLYFVGYCLVAPWAGAVSLHWGGRMQFCLYPLLAVLAADTLTRWYLRVQRPSVRSLAPVVLLVLVSVASQTYSLTLLRDKKLYSERLAQAMARLAPTVVITDVWWAGHEMYASFFDRSIYFVRSQAELEKLEAQLRARGVDSFVWATRPRPGPAAAGVVRVEDGGWGFYSLDFTVSDLR